MIRRLALAAALVVAGFAAAALVVETRYRVRASEPIAATLAQGGPVPSGLVLVFQPEDCFGSGEMVERWNRVHAAGEVPVLGLVVGDGTLSADQRRLFRTLGVRIPTRPIPARHAARVAERLGYRSTPFAVVLDRRGRVTASFPAARNVPPDVVARLASTGS